ncbi:hypothetical protein [Motilimonas eburnea]|uniref:hypothetical protein n=1 Tax=Motilimonas eburnea TaxID=1737488 RepID=UPI001E4D1E2C|nr:hypothetical protein [Motilimonas eburnea]MCE2570705.1 hypothetical protein [Motilimonas eburnea]
MLTPSSGTIELLSYGKGKCYGVTCTVPAHGEIQIEFELELQCVTTENTLYMDSLVYQLLDNSKKAAYKALASKEISGGISFLPFFGTAAASAEQVKQTMDQWGLNQGAQNQIVEAMLQMHTTSNSFKFQGSVNNTLGHEPLNGSVCLIFMECEVTNGTNTLQQRYVGPNLHLTINQQAIPIIGKLY